MKREAVFIAGLFLFFSLVSFASALGCSGTLNQSIMKIPQTDNAHGALWNQSGINICYSDLFSPSYTGQNLHDGCTDPDDGLLLKLYSKNNSHASYPTFALDSYNISVCYKGLEDCRIGSCDPDDNKCRTIVYISNKTNAHISSWSFIPASDRGYLPISCDCVGNCNKKDFIVGSTMCYEFSENEENCEIDGTDLAAKTDPRCVGGALCECVWNVSAATDCSFQLTMPGEEVGCDYICTYSESEATECSGSSKVIRTLATTTKTTSCINGLLPEGFVCQSGSATIACGDLEEASLPFFGAWQFIISLVSIAFIYALIGRKRLI